MNENVEDTFGFDQTLVLLTKPNKIIAISSQTGKLHWALKVNSEVVKLFVQTNTDEASVTIMAVTMDGLLYDIDPLTGAVLSSKTVPTLPQPIDQTEFLLVSGATDQSGRESKGVIAVPKNGEGQAVVVSDQVKLKDGRPLFISQVDKAAGTIKGL